MGDRILGPFPVDSSLTIATGLSIISDLWPLIPVHLRQRIRQVPFFFPYGHSCISNEHGRFKRAWEILDESLYESDSSWWRYTVLGSVDMATVSPFECLELFVQIVKTCFALGFSRSNMGHLLGVAM